MRRSARILASALIASIAAFASGAAVPPPAAPIYSRDTIRSFELFGVRLGMEAGSACAVLKEAGFSRGRWIDTNVDCSTFPEPDSGDTYFGRGPKAATPYGTLSFISFNYRTVGDTRRIRSISIWTDEKDQQAALEAATREQFGTPTFFAKWNYRVMNYAGTPEQADYDNRSGYGSCQYLPCMTAEEAGECLSTVNRFATPAIEVVVFDWGRTINLKDESPADHRELLDELALIANGQSVHGCPLHSIH
jgi:hypothetical protein